jgi:nicotinate-nucleotide pyrophosphorylase (carboxylating)
VLQKLGHCTLQSDYRDGQVIHPGATLLTLKGSAQTILMTERIVLNFLQRLCAIATLTSQYVEKIKHTSTRILDTRKTAPGFRHLEKYAVTCGGGVNHRMGLYDAMMIKDTHIDLLGGMSAALSKLPDTILQQCPVIVEVRTMEELEIVLESGLHKVTRVLLDNMSPALMSECAMLCRGRIATEASGNMNLDTIATVAECGVDFISVGKLTHSAGSVDLSMKCEFA